MAREDTWNCVECGRYIWVYHPGVYAVYDNGTYFYPEMECCEWNTLEDGNKLKNMSDYTPRMRCNAVMKAGDSVL
jgi:hypothetical protein